MEVVTFTIIVDDIVFPNGRTLMAGLGGGGPQTAFGARIWTTNSVGLAAGIGSDFPESCRKWLEEMDIDITGLSTWPIPTLRAWQILEADGRRTQVWRVNVGDDVWDMLRPKFSDLPLSFQKAKVYHVGVHPSARDVPFVQNLRGSGAEVISIETYTHALDIVPYSEVQALVSSCHIFSPNEKEAASLVGPGSPLEIISRLGEAGAKVVALRRGSLGSIVHRVDTGETWDIPAFHTAFQQQSAKEGKVCIRGIVDPTGCGNCFCGSFALGWWKTGDLLTAGLWGSISASLMIEHEGLPPPPLGQWREEALSRLQMLQPFAQRIIEGKKILS